MTCECPSVSYEHSPNHCPKVGQIRVRRGDLEKMLCVDCTLPGDVKLDPDEDDLTVSDLLDWKYEVASDDTLLGFEEWREHRKEAGE